MNDITALMATMKAAAEDKVRYSVLTHNDCRALVEALEARDKLLVDSESRVRQQNRHVCELFDENAALRQRIAELESRTVTVKLPSLKQPEYCERHMWSNGVFNYRSDAIGILRAAGIQVIEGEG